jgi:hypothetical protein
MIKISKLNYMEFKEAWQIEERKGALLTNLREINEPSLF